MIPRIHLLGVKDCVNVCVSEYYFLSFNVGLVINVEYMQQISKPQLFLFLYFMPG